MNPTVLRPTFHEGQIVGAADLNAVVGVARDALARHDRYQHTWGIAEGLALTATERQTALGDAYQEVTVAPGMAVDGTGRQLVLAEAELLSEDTFDQLNVAINDPEAYYPVFLTGRDESEPSSSAPATKCGSTAPTRVVEIVELTFGRVEDGADPGNQPVSEVEAGPAGTGVAPWRVLLGFVQWDRNIKRFTAVAEEHDGVGRTYAGVRADEVVARGGRLALRSAERGENGTPVLELDRGDDGELRFGPQNASGVVVPVFTVNAQGDVHAEGKITGAIAGGVQIQSGIAFDGTLLPLPAGLDQAQIDLGQVTVQTHVTPHYGTPALPSLPAGERWLMHPLECRVEGRRVFCRVRWVSTDGSGGSPLEQPGAVDFTLMAFAQEQ